MCCNNVIAGIKSKYNFLRQKVPHLINIKCDADVSLKEPSENKELYGTQVRLNTDFSLLNAILISVTAVNAVVVIFAAKKIIFHSKYKKRFN